MDVVQATLCSAWESLEQLGNPLCAERWLFSIARNNAMNCFRLRRRELCVETVNSDGEPSRVYLLHGCGPSAEEEAITKEESQALTALILDLPLPQRQAVYLCRLCGIKPAALARRLKTDSHTISGRLYRGMETLRKKLRSAGEEHRGSY